MEFIYNHIYDYTLLCITIVMTVVCIASPILLIKAIKNYLLPILVIKDKKE